MRLPRLLDGLALRVALLLTIALVPIGLIAVSLTYQIAENEANRAESAILALTAQAAASEESVMRAGATLAAALAVSLPVVRDDPVRCNGLFESYVLKRGDYSFAGYIGRDGTLTCASAGVGRNVSDSPLYRRMLETPVPRIDVVEHAAISGTSVIVMTQPVFDANGGFDGYIAISLPNQRRFRSLELLSVNRPVDLITFNDEGAVLSAEDGLEGVEGRLPRDRSLESFVGRPRTAFTGRTVDGEERAFAVVPIISNLVYALGSWPVQEIDGWFGTQIVTPLLFPGLMWLVSLGVAYMAVHRMAIRNITDLRSRMQQFTRTLRFNRAPPRRNVPLEFREIEATWQEVAESVVRDAAELENIIHTRTVLLKEVHHRVKNNLQVIASIVSMNIRKAATPEARAALKDVQMRVMSIATVHRALYTTSTVGQVRADELLSSIVNKTIEAGFLPVGSARIDSSFDAVSLYPDQAVPLSLLTAEAVTNALKYLGRPAEGGPWIRVTLKQNAPDAAVLEVENSRGMPLLPPEIARGTGLGANLIAAFTLQMRGNLTIEAEDPARFLVKVEFPIVGFDDTVTEPAMAEPN